MMCSELIVGEVSLCSWLWMGISGSVFVLQNRSRSFFAIFSVYQVLALQGEGVCLRHISVLDHVCTLL